MGIHDHAHEQLASAHVAIAHDGLRTVRRAARPSSSGERAVSRRQCGPAVLPAAPNDRRSVAGGVRRRNVCLAPAARRIGGVGVRTEGCSQHVLRAARDGRICSVCGS